METKSSWGLTPGVCIVLCLLFAFLASGCMWWCISTREWGVFTTLNREFVAQSLAGIVFLSWLRMSYAARVPENHQSGLVVGGRQTGDLFGEGAYYFLPAPCIFWLTTPRSITSFVFDVDVVQRARDRIRMRVVVSVTCTPVNVYYLEKFTDREVSERVRGAIQRYMLSLISINPSNAVYGLHNQYISNQVSDWLEFDQIGGISISAYVTRSEEASEVSRALQDAVADQDAFTQLIAGLRMQFPDLSDDQLIAYAQSRIGVQATTSTHIVRGGRGSGNNGSVNVILDDR